MAATPRGRQWWQAAWVMLAVISLAIGLLAGATVALYANSRPAVYQSKATLLIDQQSSVFLSGDAGLLAKLSQLRFKYVGLVHTQVFAKPVADDTGLPVAEVQAGLSASADVNTLLVVITASMPTPAEAQRVAQSAADHLVSYVQGEQFDEKVPSTQQVTFSVVTPASPPQQTEPSTKKVALEGVVTFLVITVAGAVGADLLRRRR